MVRSIRGLPVGMTAVDRSCTTRFHAGVLSCRESDAGRPRRRALQERTDAMHLAALRKHATKTFNESPPEGDKREPGRTLTLLG